MREWHVEHFPESPRKASILMAVQHHDDGWADVDESLVVDEASGRLLDFMEVSDTLKRETSFTGLERLASDPYAAALVAQHRLHVYRRYEGHSDWRTFFANMTVARDGFLEAADSVPLAQLLTDYRFVRAGDLASLAFCNEWLNTEPDGCGYSFHLQGKSLIIAPDPFGGRTIEVEIQAREIPSDVVAIDAEARALLASAPVVELKGFVSGRT